MTLILASSEDYFRDAGASRVVAFVGERFSYRFFNLGRGYLMDRLGHVMSLFGMNGFEVKRRKLFLERKDITVPKPVVLNSKLEVITTHDEGAGVRPGLTIRILEGKDEMGICISESLGHYQQSEGSQDTYYIGALRVHPDLQGIGWGKYLLQRTHLEMQELGYKHALLGTKIDNHRALLLYTNEGYQVIYSDYSFGKKF
ncbi:MAG: hypothetical protein JW384_04022 [Nitrosomonadaceae bacterium]|nr:hypothetical protein [Nitrosomonadaceae bacterium]